MTWLRRWLNRSIVTLNSTFQLLDIYKIDLGSRVVLLYSQHFHNNFTTNLM